MSEQALQSGYPDRSLIDATVQLGDPVEHRGIVVVPLFPRRSPASNYVTLDDAMPRGFRIREVSESGSVPSLVVENPLDKRVLLYDGEELIGLKQNRILNLTVLVEATSMVTIPVSCVEEGRWARASTEAAAARHASHPELRRAKAHAMSAEPLAHGVAQADVWDAVHEKAARMGIASRTGANADTFRSRARDLRALEDAFPAQPGQSGALLALGDKLCLDWVSRPDAFVQLWPKLRAGYMLDALERLDQAPATAAQIEAFISAVDHATVARRPSVGLGEDIRLQGERVIGSGLEHDGELLQLCAFTSAHTRRSLGRIASPVRRRPSGE